MSNYEDSGKVLAAVELAVMDALPSEPTAVSATLAVGYAPRRDSNGWRVVMYTSRYRGARRRGHPRRYLNVVVVLGAGLLGAVAGPAAAVAALFSW